MRVVLHIGQQKTGTTALQSTLVVDRDRLGRAGILYPDAGHSRSIGGELRPSHNGLFLRLQGSETRQTWQTIDEIRAELHRQIDEQQPDLLLLSAEHAFMAADHRVDVLGTLDELLPGDKEIVVYLRRPDRYLTSFHKQLVRLGMNGVQPLHSPERFATLARTCQLDHRRAIGHYIERYGEVRVFDYEQVTDTIAHFYRHVLVLDPPAERPDDTNPSIPAVFANLALTRVCRPGRPTRVLPPHEIRALLRHGEREQVDLLGASNRRRLVEYYRPHDEFLGSLVGQRSFFEHLEAMASVSADSITVEEADDRYREIFEALVGSPSVHELRRDCRLLEDQGFTDAASALYTAHSHALGEADIDWFHHELEHSTDGRFGIDGDHYIDHRPPATETERVRHLARTAVRRSATIARNRFRRNDDAG